MKYLFIFFIILYSFTLKAQFLKVSIEVGIGTYQLSGLKEINESVLSDLPINGKLVHDFPATFYYRPSISLKFKRFNFGYSHTYKSTGARISTKDYSGEYRFDMISSAHSPSLHIDYLLSQNTKIETYVRLLGGVSFSDLSVEEFFELNEEVHTNESFEFSSNNYFFEPGFYFTYPIKGLLLESHIGYHISMGDNTLTDSSGDIELTNPDNGNSIPPNWGGIRIGIGLAYAFGRD
jgi:hypothetical protein